VSTDRTHGNESPGQEDHRDCGNGDHGRAVAPRIRREFGRQIRYLQVRSIVHLGGDVQEEIHHEPRPLIVIFHPSFPDSGPRSQKDQPFNGRVGDRQWCGGCKRSIVLASLDQETQSLFEVVEISNDGLKAA